MVVTVLLVSFEDSDVQLMYTLKISLNRFSVDLPNV